MQAESYTELKSDDKDQVLRHIQSQMEIMETTGDCARLKVLRAEQWWIVSLSVGDEQEDDESRSSEMLAPVNMSGGLD